jgi:RNA polymerase sigma factor (sigma-70 family)
MQANTTDEELRYAGLLDSYRAHIVAFCARHSDSADEADELAQEVLIAVWEGIGDLRHDSSPRQVNRWLQQVMRTVWVRHLRSSRRHETVPLDSDMAADDSDARLRETLEEMTALLSPDDREVVRQRLEGYDNSEIASSLGVNTSSVNMRFFRIIPRLKKIYRRLYGK